VNGEPSSPLKQCLPDRQAKVLQLHLAAVF
jgi:hypothetical protein